MDADRFGVSQLHQLRGRVGRGGLPGLCLLVSEMPRPALPARDRLAAVEPPRLDGFELSRSTWSSAARATSWARPSPACAPPCRI
jgi:ATP-dependent DNA helicase RecG